MKQRLALVFLVLLRLAIGWHFLFEGLEKDRSIKLGQSVLIGKPWSGEQGQPWTSEPYFREGAGPLARLVKSQIGDADDLLIARMTPKPASPENSSGSSRPADRMPELLDREWNDYLSNFIAHYGLDGDNQERAKTLMLWEKDQTVLWLTKTPGTVDWLLSGQWTDFDRKPFKRKYPTGDFDVNISVADRVEEFHRKLREFRALQGTNNQFDKDVEKGERSRIRAEVMALRAELQGLLDGRTADMKKSLSDWIVSKEQTKIKGPVPAPERHWLIRWIDISTRWGLLVIGGCLILGFFSRSASLAGAIFLLMTLLTHPPLPWLPDPPNTEGHYVFVSKNSVEMIALLMLACIPSGRWFGIDGLIHALNPWRKNEPE
jgi:uncharacterized membrane protein YphA (DoxX/SURF4 family)